jgi:hypothetical protein
MNWRRGLFRLWLAASVLWVFFQGWGLYEDEFVPRQSAASVAKCLQDRKENPTLGNPFDCFDNARGNPFADLIPLGPAMVRKTILIVAPPIALFLLGYSLLWIGRGFRR